MSVLLWAGPAQRLGLATCRLLDTGVRKRDWTERHALVLIRQRTRITMSRSRVHPLDESPNPADINIPSTGA